MFIKPSNSGSSVGINKAKNNNELKKYIEYASQFDAKIILEEEIEGKEVEFPILDANIPHPTYGFCMIVNSPWIDPSSPPIPCNTGNITSFFCIASIMLPHV